MHTLRTQKKERQKEAQREMEQAREESKQQQEQAMTPLRCPRCDSLDTKFRYFNNNSPAQPRHYCKTCKRQWTVGGNLRNIPIGGKSRNGKPTKASTSTGGNRRSQSPQPLFPLGEECLQNPHSVTPMATRVSQDFDTTMFGPGTNLPSAESPLASYNYFNDEISCLDAIQSLLQPEINDQHVNAGSLFAGSNMKIQQEWNVQTMASQQATPQQISINIESHQTHNEAINAPPPPLYSNNDAQPARHTNSTAKDLTNHFSFATSNVCLGNNFSGGATVTEDITSVNIDEWLNFPDNDSL